jgi:hypothetical protein
VPHTLMLILRWSAIVVTAAIVIALAAAAVLMA